MPDAHLSNDQFRALRDWIDARTEINSIARQHPGDSTRQRALRRDLREADEIAYAELTGQAMEAEYDD